LWNHRFLCCFICSRHGPFLPGIDGWHPILGFPAESENAVSLWKLKKPSQWQDSRDQGELMYHATIDSRWRPSALLRIGFCLIHPLAKLSPSPTQCQIWTIPRHMIHSRLQWSLRRHRFCILLARNSLNRPRIWINCCHKIHDFGDSSIHRIFAAKWILGRTRKKISQKNLLPSELVIACNQKPLQKQ
jgi:hypothetical protein